jgi:hypothetical protein
MAFGRSLGRTEGHFSVLTPSARLNFLLTPPFFFHSLSQILQP